MNEQIPLYYFLVRMMQEFQRYGLAVIPLDLAGDTATLGIRELINKGIEIERHIKMESTCGYVDYINAELQTELFQQPLIDSRYTGSEGRKNYPGIALSDFMNSESFKWPEEHSDFDRLADIFCQPVREAAERELEFKIRFARAMRDGEREAIKCFNRNHPPRTLRSSE